MNIYVGNLPYETTEDELLEQFAPYGEVTSVNIIKDRHTGESRGFGFVEMRTKSAGEAAIAGLAGKEMGDRSLVVNEALPRPDRGGGPSGRGRGGGGSRGRGGGRRRF
jgi:RNA recognition motif-containing protein